MAVHSAVGVRCCRAETPIGGCACLNQETAGSNPVTRANFRSKVLKKHA